MNSREETLKKWGGAAIVLLVSLEFVVFPWLDWVESSKNEILNARTFAAKQQNVASQYADIESKLAELKEQTTLYAGLPILGKNQDPALLWLEVVEDAVARVEATVNNKVPQRAVVINDDYSVFTGRVSATGEYNRILNLLNELENISEGNRVRQVSLLQQRARQGYVTANIEFVRVYRTK
ncbi:hypothetical protein [Pseudoalteromonas byunsanensis]|uniref:General secretion pathway protein GspM n=1 Tax=Pseudoalteromonas byunsanensis TaxID=327939 RepID=A0A1S1N7A0_9GAMM|nr:hypothetical protein [Pseudoalteromonas byunsanensis]OHU95288.1 hypothetical protein BIW53_11255 [Pseudoalteromonas byunsanensis]